MGRSISPTEEQLKARLLNELRRVKRIGPNTVIASELPLGATGVRADLAYHARHLTGVEVKSDRDTLKRLHRQLPVYRQYFDRVILVVGTRHLDDAKAMDLEGVELWAAYGTTLKKLQSGVISDRSELQTQLLNASLKRHQTHNKSGEASFKAAFQARFKPTSDNFWASIEGQPIGVEHLALLSRFVERREFAMAAAKAARTQKSEWLEALTQSLHSSSVSKNDASSE